MENVTVTTRRRFGGLRDVNGDMRGRGPVGAWFSLGLGFGENCVRVTGTLAQKFRQETVDRVRSTLDWAAGFPRGGFELAAMLVDAMDVLASDAANRVQAASLTLMQMIDKTGTGVGEAASRAVNDAEVTVNLDEARA